MAELITQAEYARRRGCSKVAVHKAIKTGKIALVDGLIDEAAADAAWERNRDPRQGSKIARAIPGPENSPEIGTDPSESAPAAADGLALTVARTRHEVAKARRAELGVKELEHKLIDGDKAEAAWAGMIKSARQKALLLPSELGPKVAVESDPIQCSEIIRTGIFAMLTELAEYRPHA